MSASTEIRVRHGAQRLPAVRVDSYNVAIRENGGFVGDEANSRAFNDIIDAWRARMRQEGVDPFGATPTEAIRKKEFDAALARGDPEAGGIVHGAIEQFANSLAKVIKRFLSVPEWTDTPRIMIGGGFREARIGELAIGRAGVLLRADRVSVELRPIRKEPDDAGLIGAVHLLPPNGLSGADGLLAVDIGGSHIRCGIVAPERGHGQDLPRARVIHARSWKHADQDPDRDQAVDRLVAMLNDMIEYAGENRIALARFIGVGCPGQIRPDGTIARGAQNLPGNWEHERFHLPSRVENGVGSIDGTCPTVILHNDAVVQGLSELPFMQDVSAWGMLTIGTGLGNARFTNCRISSLRRR